MNKILLSALISTSFLSLTTFAAIPPQTSIQAQKQVAGYYQYQAGDVQITALLDGTNFMSPNLFKDIPQQQVQEILKILCRSKERYTDLSKCLPRQYRKIAGTRR